MATIHNDLGIPSHVAIAGLEVATCLAELVRTEITPGTGITPEQFWAGLAEVVNDLGPRNSELLARRDQRQAAIDAWLRARRGIPIACDEQRAFLLEIGYLLPEQGPVRITTEGVDPEIAQLAGPQLVVPVDNARYALNAANARWGSLYDALYGTDVIPETDGAEQATSYNPERGRRVIEYAAEFLDAIVPLESGSHAAAIKYQLASEGGQHRLQVKLRSGIAIGLKDPDKFVGFRGSEGQPEALLFRNHGLHIELQFDPQHSVGAAHPANIKDIILESALTTIQDCEDSVAAVDAKDKTRVYRNWLGLMNGTLTARFTKNGTERTRRLNTDRRYRDVDGTEFSLRGTSVLLVRNVGMHMYTDAVRTAAGASIPEGFLDAMVTALAAKHDLAGKPPGRNSRTGSIYIVKPKLHGPEEVAATVELFERVERLLELPPRTIKIGIMDEERRTTLNLIECIRAASDRVIFINTGFLDRTGDEIHTLMELGPVIRKNDIKTSTWMLAYEDSNVDIGLAAGLSGRAQIGKGMWAMPDEMADMLAVKIEHPRAGANTAWVPSPTAATLHAMHYHYVNVRKRQQELAARRRPPLESLLTMPLLGGRSLSRDKIAQELANNAQGILGYVVKWVEHGIGCSKVEDINDVGMMEDRATLRISSQHIANWLYYRLITRDQVEKVFREMAVVVDRQNSGDPVYRPMAPDPDQSMAFQAALELVFSAREQPNGYTESVLHAWRRRFKQANDL
jgi:malate synthase